MAQEEPAPSRKVRKTKTTVESIRFQQYLAHEWPLKDAVDKGLDGGKAADAEQAVLEIEGRLFQCARSNYISLGNCFTKGCGISHLALVLEPKTLREHLSDHHAFSFSLAGSSSGG